MLDYLLFDDIDDDLYDLRWHLHNYGYAQTGGGNNKRYAHRIVLERKIGRPLVKGELCDHINRDKLDNRRENLRVANKSINAVNTQDKENISGYRGVYKKWSKQHRIKGWKPSYYFRIYRVGYPVFTSKYFKTAKEAHLTRIEKLKEYDY